VQRSLITWVLALAATGGAPAGQPAGQPTESAPPLVRHLYPKGLVAFWSADGHRRDSVGNSHGAGEVAYTADRHGNPQGAFLFADKTGAVTVGDNARLDTDDAFTLSLWIKPTKDRCDRHILTKWLNSGRHADFSLILRPDGRLSFTVCNSRKGFAEDSLKGKVAIGADAWTHVAATFDRGVMKLYVNAKLDAERTSRTVLHTDRQEYEHDDLVIGGFWTGEDPFRGAIDEVGLWNRALSAAEIRGVFAFCSTARSPLARGLVALWSGDGTAGDAAGRHHGGIAGRVSYTTDRHGRPKSAFSFHGGPGYVSVPDAPELDTDEAFTLSAWICSAGPTARKGQFFTKWGRTQHEADYSLQFGGDGRVLFYVCRRDGMETLWSRSRIAPSRWTHLVATFDRGRMAVYVDGERSAAKTSGKVPHTNRHEYEHDELTIGGWWQGEVLHGAMDDVAIWRRALSAEEVRAVSRIRDLRDVLSAVSLPHVRRDPLADCVVLRDGKSIKGKIQAAAYDLTTPFGRLHVPAERVVALAVTDGGGRAWLLLADGQALIGRVAQQTVRCKLASGSILSLPLGEVRQCGYRVSRDKPARPPSPAPAAMLRSGARLAWDALECRLQLRTAHGTVALAPDGLLGIDRTPRGWCARFANGSLLSGTLLPEALRMKLRLGPAISLRREQIVRLAMAGKPALPSGGAVAVLRNGDRLFGRLAAGKLALKTKFGDAVVTPQSIVTMDFDANAPAAVTAETWDGTELRGRLAEGTLGFTIAPGGPTLRIQLPQLASIARKQALPPPQVARRIEALIARLGAESYKDREAAARALSAMGPRIVHVLRKYLKDPDPEIRQRIEDILEKLNPKPPPPPPSVGGGTRRMPVLELD